MDLLVNYALAHTGAPYRWGGSNPLTGFDCSGFVQWLLQSVGLDPPGDQSAQSLYDHFASHGKPKAGRGALVFYGESPLKITHVALMLDAHRVIEAGGGGKLTKTVADAAACSACVRVRMANARKDIVGILMPNYATIGQGG